MWDAKRFLSNKAAPAAAVATTEESLQAELAKCQEDLTRAYEADDRRAITMLREQRDSIQQDLKDFREERAVRVEAEVRRHAAEHLNAVQSETDRTEETRQQLADAGSNLESSLRWLAVAWYRAEQADRAYATQRAKLAQVSGDGYRAGLGGAIASVARLPTGLIGPVKQLAEAVAQLDEYRAFLGDFDNADDARAARNAEYMRTVVEAPRLGLIGHDKDSMEEIGDSAAVRVALREKGVATSSPYGYTDAGKPVRQRGGGHAPSDYLIGSPFGHLNPEK